MNILRTDNAIFGAKLNRQLERRLKEEISNPDNIEKLKNAISTNNDDVITFNFKKVAKDWDNPRSKYKSMPCISMLGKNGERSGMVILNPLLWTETNATINAKIKKLLMHKDVLKAEIIKTESSLKRLVKKLDKMDLPEN